MLWVRKMRSNIAVIYYAPDNSIQVYFISLIHKRILLFPSKSQESHVQDIINSSAAMEKMANMLTENLLALEVGCSFQTCPVKPALSNTIYF